MLVITDRKRLGKLRGVEVWQLASIKVLPVFVQTRSSGRSLTAEQRQLDQDLLRAAERLFQTERFYFTYDGQLNLSKSLMQSAVKSTMALWQEVLRLLGLILLFIDMSS